MDWWAHLKIQLRAPVWLQAALGIGQPYEWGLISCFTSSKLKFCFCGKINNITKEIHARIIKNIFKITKLNPGIYRGVQQALGLYCDQPRKTTGNSVYNCK